MLNPVAFTDPPSAPPRFCVVIPTCGRQEALAQCLERLAPGSQTLPGADYEVVVSDDGHADMSAQEVVESRYPWARWVPGPRRGPAANRNAGAAHARASWLVFTDDDCLPSAGWLASFARYLDLHPACQVLEGRTTDGNAPAAGPFFTAPLNLEGGFLWSCNLAMARALFHDLGGFDENFPFPHLEDVDLRLRLEDRQVAFEFVPEASVDHPPRPLGSAWKWARSQESSYYLAAKRGVPVQQVGFSAAIYARGSLRYFRHSRGPLDFVRVPGRILAEVLLVAWQIPYWQRRYRVVPARLEAKLPSAK